MNSTLPVVLAAEDEETDRFILNLAFQKAGISGQLIVVSDGQQAVDYLSGNAPYADRAVYPAPAMLMLDLKMPRMSGFDVLAWLATRPDLKNLPTVILSSTSDESDIRRAREMGAREFFTKPHDLSTLVEIIHDLHSRWLADTPTQAAKK
jgi:CheY-like chemotaxis protein